MSLVPATTVNLSKEKYHLLPIKFMSPNDPRFSSNNSYGNEYAFNSEEQCPLVKEQEIFIKLMNILKSMKDVGFINSGEGDYYTKYKWSFYEEFGIPPYSKTTPCLLYNHRTLFKRFNYRGPWRTWRRGNPSNNLLDWLFETDPDNSVFNIFNDHDYKYNRYAQPHSLFLIINWKKENIINDNTNYKIHFMVEECYAVYVLIKAMMILCKRDKDKGLSIQRNGKIILGFRKSKFPQTGERIPETSRNTTIPTVVIYTGTDSAEEAKEILEVLLEAFPEHDAIGLMDLGVANKIPYGNIRLNKLICYAQGDRQTKLSIKKRNLDEILPEGSTHRIEKYQGITYYLSPGQQQPVTEKPENFPPTSLNISEKMIPDWVNTMISKCVDSEGEINKRSQAFFGINFCDPIYANLPSKCNIEPLCYFAVNKSCLDPNTIKGIQDVDTTEKFSAALTLRSSSVGGRIQKKTRKYKKRGRKSRRNKLNA